MHSPFEILQILRVPGMGPVHCRVAVDGLGGARAVLEAPEGRLAALPGWGGVFARGVHRHLRAERTALEHFASEQLRAASDADVTLVSLWDPGYPPSLREIPDPPCLLFMRGSLTPEDRAALALVGSREATPRGRLRAAVLAQAASRAGLTVVSGLARGIDTVVHQATLRVHGRTIAVVGSGLDVPYPPENASLAARIAASGAVVSEFPMGTRPDRRNFPRRNRLISGLSLGTVVVESSLSGGGMITARLALDQGRDVFAVPGPVGAEHSAGTNALIREGRAKLIESFDDVLTDIAPELRRALGG